MIWRRRHSPPDWPVWLGASWLATARYKNRYCPLGQLAKRGIDRYTFEQALAGVRNLVAAGIRPQIIM